MGNNGRGVMYYTGAFWVVAIIVLLIIIIFACGCTDWNGKSCQGKSNIGFDKKSDDQFEEDSFNSQFDD